MSFTDLARIAEFAIGARKQAAAVALIHATAAAFIGGFALTAPEEKRSEPFGR